MQTKINNKEINLAENYQVKFSCATLVAAIINGNFPIDSSFPITHNYCVKYQGQYDDILADPVKRAKVLDFLQVIDGPIQDTQKGTSDQNGNKIIINSKDSWQEILEQYNNTDVQLALEIVNACDDAREILMPDPIMKPLMSSIIIVDDQLG